MSNQSENSENISARSEKSATVRPSPLSSRIGIAAGFTGLILGIFFIAAVPAGPGGAEFINIFFVIWFAVCIGMIVYGLVNLRSFTDAEKSKIPATSSDVVTLITPDSNTGENDFDAKLRKLEALKNDKLISAEEYRKKRAEILADKW